MRFVRAALVLGVLLAIGVGVGVHVSGSSREAQPRVTPIPPSAFGVSMDTTSTSTTTTTTEVPVTTTAPPTTQPRPVERPTVAAGNGECANPVVSEATARRESGCRWDAYNATGCEGYGCVGFFQIHNGHYMNPSPWGGRGACVELAGVKWEQWAQIECASRLGPGAWG